MANVKNFGLIGVGTSVQFGKTGPFVTNNAGTFNLKTAGGADVALTTAGITSSAGGITLTTGNLVATAGDLVATAGILTLNDTSLSRSSAGVMQFNGTGAVIVPAGTAGQQPGVQVAGMFRYNSDVGGLEFSNGTAWTSVATGGGTGELQAQIDAIEASLGDAIDPTDGTFLPGAFDAPIAAATSFTDAINQLAAYADGHDTFDEIFPALATGNVIYSDGGNLWAQAAPGATSGVQGYDAGLAALAVKTTTGILVQTGADTYSSVTLVAPAAGITITNEDGVAGNPTFALADDLAALEGLTTDGYIVRTGDGTMTTRSLSGTTDNIVVTNGDGVASDTSIDLAPVTQAISGDFVKVTMDGFGRVIGNTPVVQADITALVSSVYVDVSGDTMTGNLSMGGNSITNLANPVADSDAANKAYVDATAAGLSWKVAVIAASTANIDLTTGGPLTIDGVAVVATNRVLVKNQTVATENGIYVVNAGAWTRAADADSGPELDSAAVFVQQGTVNSDTGWVQTASNITVGVTPIVWSQFSGGAVYVGGTGIDITGNTISVLLGAGIAALPTDEVGIDLFDATTGALILTLDGTSRSTASAAQIYLLVDPAGALIQSATGLAINAASVTNAMLVNEGVALNGDTGTSTLDLGQTLEVIGDSVQGIVTSVAAQTVTITASDATDVQKGVASFDSASFTVTAGDVVLNTVDVLHGGTGLDTVPVSQILYGDGSNPLKTSANFVFDDVDTLTVGGVAAGVSIQGDGSDAIFTVLAADGDLVLLPNGAGSVVVGPVGAGLIQSDVGTTLTVRGNDGLTLETGSTDIIMLVPTGTGTKVTIGGATAADYATGLAAEDLVNKQYVDDAIASGAAAGAIKAVTATIDLSAGGTTNVGALLPAGSTILSVKVQVTAADTATGTLSVGKAGSVAAYMTTVENDTQTIGMYLAETYVVEAGTVTVIATVAGTPGGAGSANVIVEYKVAG